VRWRHFYEPQDVYNVDKTGLATVQKPVRIIAGKGEKQVDRMTSAERETLITMCCAVNAIGNSIPPFYIFPRVHFKPAMIAGGPVGCVGVAPTSGWMTGEGFIEWTKHFIAHTKCSLSAPVLLLLDNHECQTACYFWR
jgi:hypothetical protein